MSKQVLLVDDEQKVLKAYERNLGIDFDIAVEACPEQALMRIKHEGPFAVILSDYNMPKLNGNDFLRKAKELAPDSVRIMLTGYADLEKAMVAVNEGSVFRFLTKPCQLPALKQSLIDGIKQYRLVTAEKELLNKTLNGSIQVLMEILSILDHAAFSLAQKRRVAARKLATSIGISDLWAIEIAALLSEIGIVTLPDDTAERYLAGIQLDEVERKMIESLPEMSAKLVKRIPRLETVADIIAYQGKNYDGTGPPKDAKKERNLPAGSRILKALNDYFRIVMKGSSPNEALEMMKLSANKYDPDVLQNLQSCIGQIGPVIADESKLKKVGLNNLKAGQVLRSDVRTQTGMLILKANQTLGPTHIQRIHNFASSDPIEEPILVEG